VPAWNPNLYNGAVEAPFDVHVSVLENGSCSEHVNPEQAIVDFKHQTKPAWLHIVYRDKEAVATYLESLGFHPLAVEDAINDSERPTLHEYEDHLFLSASKVTSEGDVERFTEIGFFATKSSLVTVAPEAIPLIESWFARWKKSPDRFGNPPIDLMHSVMDAIVDEYYVIVDKMEDEVDGIIDDIYRGEDTQLKGLLKLKRRLIDLRRHVTPMRDIVNGLLRRDVVLIPASARAYFQDIYDHTLRVAELADINRETLTSALEVHLSTVSNNLNAVMKKMTVISTVLMSGALIAGIYGMNFKHMPELSWFWGYPFALLLMLVSGLGIIGLFRWKKWL
jgi:magnesium transporter